MSLYEQLQNIWAEPPMFQDEHKYDPGNVPVQVHDGIMNIQYFDHGNRRLIINLANIEFIDKIKMYLTFHMKSGQKHTIYVGSSEGGSSFADHIMNGYINFCIK